MDTAEKLINEGNFTEALKITYQIRALGSTPLISYYASGLLINIGDCIGEKRFIEEGKALLEFHFKEIVTVEALSQSAHYNLANAYLFSSDLDYRSKLFLVGETALDVAKFHYREALKIGSNSLDLAQVLVNLANCLDNLGRVVEALDYYDQALKINPKFGMALGNKAKALWIYADLCGEHQGTMVLEAYSLLKKIKTGVTPEAKINFNRLQEFLKSVATNLPLDTPPILPGIKLKAKTKLEEYLIGFCLENRLYLNVCNFCQRCDAAIGDTVIIKQMHVSQASDKSYLVLSSYLNQIKQDYVTARALLVLSRYPKLNLDLFDKQVVLVDTQEKTVDNIYVQLVKTSFITLYNILDKLAFFVNDYLKLGINEDYVNFSNLWYEDPKKTAIRPAILTTMNLSLNALYDIHKDLDAGAYKQLKKTRNALTHRFVKIKSNSEVKSDTVISEENLVNQTILLATVVRNGIIYLLQFVNLEERKKSPTNKNTKHIIVHAIPDKSKRRKVKRK